MRPKLSASSLFLTLYGIILMGLGLYFIFIRLPLLPEDSRFMSASLDDIQALLPGLLIWLRRVFWVMGGFMFSAGLLLAYVAQTAIRTRAGAAWLIVTIAALSSTGWMSVVNFLIDSDFKWLLFSFNLPWVIALILSVGERRNS